MAIEIKIPPAGESIKEVMISEWLVEDGAYVDMDQPVVSIETDKASMEIVAEKAGTVSIGEEENAVVAVGTVIGSIDDSAAKPAGGAAPAADEAPAADAPAPPAEAASGDDHYAKGHPSPAAATELAGKGLSASDVAGTGKDGRVTLADAKAASAKPASSAPSASGSPAPGADAAAADADNATSQRRVPMSMLRRTLATRLVNVKNQTAMLTTFNEVDLSQVMEVRKRYKEAFKEKHEVNLGFMSFFTKACTIALQEIPEVNAFIDGNDIVYNEHNNISIAVSTKKGLVVPVIKKAEAMSFAEVEQTIVNYAMKARDGKITMDDMDGGTFTITNGGVFGSMLSTPIINPPQSAILGMHNIVQRPVAVNGEVVIRPMMYIALSYDHRIIDGKEAVTFLVRVKETLEDPYRYFLGL